VSCRVDGVFSQGVLTRRRQVAVYNDTVWGEDARLDRCGVLDRIGAMIV